MLGYDLNRDTHNISGDSTFCLMDVCTITSGDEILYILLTSKGLLCIDAEGYYSDALVNVIQSRIRIYLSEQYG